MPSGSEMSSRAERTVSDMSMWYEKYGKEQDVVLSTKAFIVRNIKGYNFPDKMSDSDFDSLEDKIDEAVDKTVTGNIWSANALGSGDSTDSSLLYLSGPLYRDFFRNRQNIAIEKASNKCTTNTNMSFVSSGSTPLLTAASMTVFS